MTAAVHWSSSPLSTFRSPTSYRPPDESSPQEVMRSNPFHVPPATSRTHRIPPPHSTAADPNASYLPPTSWYPASREMGPMAPLARPVPVYGSPGEPRSSPPAQPDGRLPFAPSSFGSPAPGRLQHSTYPGPSLRNSFSDPPPTNEGGYPTYSGPDTQSSSRSSTGGLSRQTRNRCHLHIRQHPRATRAGPDGKDRRAIDPPPILQLMMDDFDPDNADDVAEMRSPFWVVHCRLVGPRSPTDMSTMTQQNESGEQELQRLLLGTSVASPTQTSDDPDPETMPTHPTTKALVTAPASPTTRFLPLASRPAVRAPREPHQIPGAFFIFADVSVRRAGQYRLQFTLMKMEPEMLNVGSTVPSIDVVTSEVFRAVNAKDFDQVKPSTNLVRGLIERGAGFPLKLKKGARDSTKRRTQQSGEDSDNESGDEDGYFS